MGSVFLLIGPPGSGRTEYVNQFTKTPNISVIRSQDNQDILYKRIKRELDFGNNVMYNAANCSYKKREQFIKGILKECPETTIHGILFTTPIGKCIENDKKGKEPQGEEVVKMMKEQLESKPPQITDGFDSITKIKDTEQGLVIEGMEIGEKFKLMVMEKMGKEKEKEQ